MTTAQERLDRAKQEMNQVEILGRILSSRFVMALQLRAFACPGRQFRLATYWATRGSSLCSGWFLSSFALHVTYLMYKHVDSSMNVSLFERNGAVDFMN